MSGMPFKALMGKFLQSPSGPESTQSAQGDALASPSPSSHGTQSTVNATGGTQSTAPRPAPSPVASQGTINRPMTPVMGGITVASKDEYVGWMGGKPKANWSGLDPTGVTILRVPTQIQPTYASSSAKAYLHRVTGLETKLAANGANFLIFCNKVHDHLVDTGMEPISYLPDPHDPSMDMLLVVHHYSHFNLEYAIVTWKSYKGLLDPYDQSNNQAAIKFL